MLDWRLIVLILMSVGYCFVNGRNDGRNVVATIISSRSIEPRRAIAIAAAVEFIVPLVIGTTVASTICTGIVSANALFMGGTDRAYILIFSALISAMTFSMASNRLGLPSSASHALIGGLLGGGMLLYGITAIVWKSILLKVILMLFLTPVLGLAAGYIIIRLIVWFFCNAHFSVNEFFKKAQVFGTVFLAAAHSSNDSQKSMGIIALLLFTGGVQDDFHVSIWVKIVCAASLSLGLYFAGWRVVKTVGQEIFRLKPIHSFASQLGASIVLTFSGLLGSPVSTSQIVASSVVGVGTGKNPSAIRWKVVKNILISWLTTIPTTAMLSAALSALLLFLIGGNIVV